MNPQLKSSSCARFEVFPFVLRNLFLLAGFANSITPSMALCDIGPFGSGRRFQDRAVNVTKSAHRGSVGISSSGRLGLGSLPTALPFNRNQTLNDGQCISYRELYIPEHGRLVRCIDSATRRLQLSTQEIWNMPPHKFLDSIRLFERYNMIVVIVVGQVRHLFQ